MRMRTSTGLLAAMATIFVLFLGAAGFNSFACDGCKMTVTRGTLIDTIQCPSINCAVAGGACGFHTFQGIFGKKNQCRCGGQGGTTDGCTCRATAQMSGEHPDEVTSVTCDKNGCLHDCTNNFGAAGLPIGVPVEVCEC